MEELYGKALDQGIYWGNVSHINRKVGKQDIEILSLRASRALHDLAEAFLSESKVCPGCKGTGVVSGLDGDGRESEGKCGH